MGDPPKEARGGKKGVWRLIRVRQKSFAFIHLSWTRTREESAFAKKRGVPSKGMSDRLDWTSSEKPVVLGHA